MICSPSRAVVIACGVLTFFLLPFVTPFAEMGEPDLAMMLLILVAASHFAGLVMGFCFKRVSVVSALAVCGICLAPVAFLGIDMARDAYYVKYHGVDI